MEFKALDGIAFLGAALPISYADRYDDFPLLSEGHEQAQRVLLTKSSHWRYEGERRVVIVPSPAFGDQPCNRYYSIPPEALSGVIFGCQMSEQHKTKVMEWISRSKSKLTLYEATLKKQEYGLDVTRIRHKPPAPLIAPST